MSETSVVLLRAGSRVLGIVPTSVEEVFRLATAIAKSGMAPRGMDKPEALTVAIMHGLEIGLLALLRGDREEWAERIAGAAENVGGRDE